MSLVQNMYKYFALTRAVFKAWLL